MVANLVDSRSGSHEAVRVQKLTTSPVVLKIIIRYQLYNQDDIIIITTVISPIAAHLPSCLRNYHYLDNIIIIITVILDILPRLPKVKHHL